MTFREVAYTYLRDWFVRLHMAKPDLTWREYLAGFADAITTAAADLSGKAIQADPGVGLEVDVTSDYDPASGFLIADIHLRMVGPAPYTVSSVLLAHGFQFLVDDGTFHTTLRAPLARIQELRA